MRVERSSHGVMGFVIRVHHRLDNVLRNLGARPGADRLGLGDIASILCSLQLGERYQERASLLYNFGSMLINAGEPAAAVPELDGSHDQYASLIGTAADAELLCLLWLQNAGQPDPWQPPGTGRPPRDLPPTLAEALGRHATGAAGEDLAAILTADHYGGPWTTSMRWPPGLPLAGLEASPPG